MSTVPLTYWWPHPDGTLHRWMRDPVSVDKPDPPTALVVTQSPTATTADLTWGPPVSDGGSAVTGFVVTPPVGSPVTLGATTFTYHVTGLTPGVPVTFRVAAVTSFGTGPVASVTSSFALFPGHTLAKLTGKMWLGVDEGDKDPAKVTSPEVGAPQTLAGTPPAATRFYYNDWSAIDLTTGQWLKDIRSLYAKGRVCWGSFSIRSENWAQEIDGRHDADLDGFIAWCEETAPDVPIPVSPKHEPNFTSTAGFTAADFGRWGRWFRSRMDLYAAAHGGVGVYKWKRLSFGPIHTAQDYAKTTGTPGPVQPSWDAAAKITATVTASSDTFTSNGHLLSNGRRVKLISPPGGLDATTNYYVVSATANTFKVSATLGGAAANVTADASGVTVVSRDVYDWMAADPYVSRGGSLTSYWTANMDATVKWVEDPAHTYPFAFTEFAVYNRDGTGATKLQQVYDRLLDGSHDVFAVLYYNSGDQTYASTDPLFTEFILDNVNNGGLLNKYVALLQDPRSVHFWDSPKPDGSFYARPPGV